MNLRLFFACLLACGSISAADRAKQATEDAQQDHKVIIFDGQSPNKLVCDATLRAMPDRSWVLLMLGGGDTEPQPENGIFITRSTDRGKTWSPMEQLDFGFKREGTTMANVPSELMVHGQGCTLFFSTHDGIFGGWKSWMVRSDDSCRTRSKAEPVLGRLHDRTFIRNHIVTRDGRILVPFSITTVSPPAPRCPRTNGSATPST